jgi:hypothetical protein
MERKQPFNWKRISLETSLILIVTIAIAWAVSTTIHMTAPAALGQASIYADQACTPANLINPPSWDWAQHGVTGLTNGATIGVWIKNTGTITLNVTISILNPTCLITVDPQIFQLPGGAVQGLTLTFSQIIAGSTVSWDLKADY